MFFEIVISAFLFSFFLLKPVKTVFINAYLQIFNDGIFEYILWCYRCIVINFHQRLSKKRMNEFHRNSDLLKLSGIIPTDGDTEMETCKVIDSKYLNDSITIWGGDKTGRVVIVSINHMKNGDSFIDMLVRDSSGRTFTQLNKIPVLGNPSSTSWRAGGLLLECIEPMRIWRLKFNGQLRELESVGDCQQNIINCRLDFLWQSLKKPIDVWKETSSQLLANTIPTNDLVKFLDGMYVDGYDQWGSLHGMITIEERESENWYLRGLRQHRFSKLQSKYSVKQCTSIRHYSSNGDMLYLEICSEGSPINRYTLGYFLTSNGSYHSITNAALQYTREQDNDVLLVNFIADREKKEEYFPLQDEITSITENVQNKIYVAGNENGWSYLSVLSQGVGQTKLRRTYPRIEISENVTAVPLVISLEDEKCKLPSISGGKGSSLSSVMNLISYSSERDFTFQVPKGFVVTTNSWTIQLEKNLSLRHEIDLLQKIMASDTDVATIKHKCNEINSIITNTDVYIEIANKIQDLMESTFTCSDSSKRLFAVRSSACGEDGLESSSAGQNETILGCPHEDDFNSILSAVAKCWASQFTYQSAEYRRQRGQPIDSGMAVVIQEMVQSSVAGVIFTNDPTTGKPNSILITANYGLGESVVSASTEPDTIYIKRKNPGLEIENVVIGEKRHKSVLKEGGGIETVEIENTNSRQICLKDEYAIYLANVAILIENVYGSPKDIEFAFNQDTLYILQVRPITTLEAWTDYEIIHEADSAVITDNELYTIANTGEVLPSYLDPLTLSFIPKQVDLSSQSYIYLLEFPYFEYEISYLKCMATFSHRCMINVGQMLYRTVEENVSISNNAVDLSLFGRLITTTEIHSWAKKRFGLAGNFEKVSKLIYSIFNAMLNTYRIRRSKPISNMENIDSLSSSSYYEMICKNIPHQQKIISIHCHTSSASTLTQFVALIVLSEGAKVISPESLQIMAALFECISNTESADVPKSLEELSAAIYATGKSEEFISLSNEMCCKWLRNKFPKIATMFETFLTNHGHRCFKEFYLTSLSWNMHPESLMPSLKQMTKSRKYSCNKKSKKNIEESLESLTSHLKPSTKFILKIVLKFFGATINQREKTKSMTIRGIDAFKKAYRHLAHLMVKEFRLPDTNLIYFLTHYEIKTLLRTRSASLVLKAARRRKIMKTIEKYEFPEISVGIPQSINPEEIFTNIDYDIEAHFGTPVCFGSIKGIVRVVIQIEEAEFIQEGEILITRCTDIGWAPFFPLLGGIVTELGGLISHVLQCFSFFMFNVHTWSRIYGYGCYQ